MPTKPDEREEAAKSREQQMRPAYVAGNIAAVVDATPNEPEPPTEPAMATSPQLRQSNASTASTNPRSSRRAQRQNQQQQQQQHQAPPPPSTMSSLSRNSNTSSVPVSRVANVGKRISAMPAAFEPESFAVLDSDIIQEADDEDDDEDDEEATDTFPTFDSTHASGVTRISGGPRMVPVSKIANGKRVSVMPTALEPERFSIREEGGEEEEEETDKFPETDTINRLGGSMRGASSRAVPVSKVANVSKRMSAMPGAFEPESLAIGEETDFDTGPTLDTADRMAGTMGTSSRAIPVARVENVRKRISAMPGALEPHVMLLSKEPDIPLNVEESSSSSPDKKPTMNVNLQAVADMVEEEERAKAEERQSRALMMGAFASPTSISSSGPSSGPSVVQSSYTAPTSRSSQSTTPGTNEKTRMRLAEEERIKAQARQNRARASGGRTDFSSFGSAANTGPTPSPTSGVWNNSTTGGTPSRTSRTDQMSEEEQRLKAQVRSNRPQGQRRSKSPVPGTRTSGSSSPIRTSVNSTASGSGGRTDRMMADEDGIKSQARQNRALGQRRSKSPVPTTRISAGSSPTRDSLSNSRRSGSSDHTRRILADEDRIKSQARQNRALGQRRSKSPVPTTRISAGSSPTRDSLSNSRRSGSGDHTRRILADEDRIKSQAGQSRGRSTSPVPPRVSTSPTINSLNASTSSGSGNRTRGMIADEGRIKSLARQNRVVGQGGGPSSIVSASNVSPNNSTTWGSKDRASSGPGDEERIKSQARRNRAMGLTRNLSPTASGRTSGTSAGPASSPNDRTASILADEERVKSQARQSRAMGQVPSSMPSDLVVCSVEAPGGETSISSTEPMLLEDDRIRQQARQNRQMGSALNEMPSDLLVCSVEAPGGNTTRRMQEEERIKDQARRGRATANPASHLAQNFPIGTGNMGGSEPSLISPFDDSPAQPNRKSASSTQTEDTIQGDERIKAYAQQQRPGAVGVTDVNFIANMYSDHTGTRHSASTTNDSTPSEAFTLEVTDQTRRSIIEEDETIKAAARASRGGYSDTGDGGDLVIETVTLSNQRYEGGDVPLPRTGDSVLLDNGARKKERGGRRRTRHSPHRSAVDDDDAVPSDDIDTEQLDTTGRTSLDSSSQHKHGRSSDAAAVPSAPEEDFVVPVGAVSVFTNGMIVQQQPGQLSNQPQLHAQRSMPQVYEENLWSNNGEEIEADAERLEESPSAIDVKVGEKEATPFYKTKFFCLIAVVLVLGVVFIAVVLALGGGDDGGGGGNDNGMETDSPTLSPTEELLDPLRLQVSRFHIVDRLTSEADLDDTSTPQYKAIRWLVRDDTLESILSEDMTEVEIHVALTRYALAVFYYGLDGPRWADQDGWLDPRIPFCDWDHIKCSETVGTAVDGGAPVVRDDVVFIRTATLAGLGNGRNNFLQGTLPSEINYFSSLSLLNLNANKISDISVLDGTKLTVLETVDFSENPLQDISSLLSLPALRKLYLASTGLQGTLAPEWGKLTRLLSLELQKNQLSGTISTLLGNFPKLRDLIINENNFQGDIGEMISKFNKTRFELFSIFSNQFSGSLPTIIGQFPRLEQMFIYKNRLEGTIPTELGRAQSLQTIDISFNPEIRGNLPTELGNLRSLTNLNIRKTGLSGTIPAEYGRMFRLQSFDFEDTLLTGTIPPGVCELPELFDIFTNTDVDECP